jgi:hypothetical protein
MSAVVGTPIELVEAVAAMRLPPKTDARLQQLLDRNTNGELSATERDNLGALVELSENMALIRARALHVLGRRPS